MCDIVCVCVCMYMCGGVFYAPGRRKDMRVFEGLKELLVNALLRDGLTYA